MKEKLIISKFCEIAANLNIEGFYFDEFLYNDSVMTGVFELKNSVLPYYDIELDEWFSFDEENEKSEILEFHYNFYENGLWSCGILGDGDHSNYMYLYSPYEIQQFLFFANNLPKSKILNKEINFLEFDLTEVIKGVYLTIITDNKIKIIDVNLIKQKITNHEFKLILIDILGIQETELLEELKNDQLLIEEFPDNSRTSEDNEEFWGWSKIIGDWTNFCLSKNFPLIDEFNKRISILYRHQTHLPTYELYHLLKFQVPFFAFELKEDFSCQYFFDYLNYSKNGDGFLRDLVKYLTSESTYSPTIIAPKNFISQMTYSISFRYNFYDYLNELTSYSNYISEEIFDIKEILKNRKENFKEFLLNTEKSNFLTSLKNPLPFIIEKSFRSYSRASSEFDRQYHGLRLYSIILKSIVLYPLQEILYMKTEEQFPEINEILKTINSGKNISDGTWQVWFQTISKLYWKQNILDLKYFGSIFHNMEKYKDIFKNIIPERNDWGHYRKHPGVFQKILDEILPKLLFDLRNSLTDIDFILVKGLDFKNDGNLYVKAKKIMGFEVDIETFEFQTNLSPNFFISDKFYAFKKGMNYTIPLDPFFTVKLETIEIIKMGIFDSFNNGDFKYVF
jgi:hypothetical protein